MSYEYDQYLREHKEYVAEGFQWLQKNLPDVVEAGQKESIEWQVCCNHDTSKSMPEEYDAYDKYFYGGNRSYAVMQEFREAWLHHIHHNPHHWQHWILINDNPDEGEIVMDMPYVYIVEAICDWWAFSWKNENLFEIFSWYDEHKAYMKLSDKTRKTVEDILTKIKTKLEE